METKYTSLLERYFDDLLSSEEKTEVAKLKETDTDFLKEYELFEKAHKAVRLSTIIDLKAKIKETHKNMDKPSKGGKVIKLQWLRVAAGLLLLFGLGVGFYAQQFSNRSLYQEAYTPVGDYVTNMDNNLSEIEKAMELFDEQRFDEASQLFNKVYNTTGEQVALFYKGHSDYRAGRLKQAITSWDEISNDYRSEAQWYIALAYLESDDVSSTTKTLNVIIKENRDKVFVLKAKELRKKLQSSLRKLVVLK